MFMSDYPSSYYNSCVSRIYMTGWWYTNNSAHFINNCERNTNKI